MRRTACSRASYDFFPYFLPCERSEQSCSGVVLTTFAPIPCSLFISLSLRSLSLSRFVRSVRCLLVPEDEIPRFTDPLVWLQYFPPRGRKDVTKFGTAVDWRRSFVTTSVNPFYDSFIRWQFNTLKARTVQYGTVD